MPLDQPVIELPDKHPLRIRAEKAEYALRNIYTLARRQLRYSDDAPWRHVRRLCEDAGCAPRGVLRDDYPAEAEIAELATALFEDGEEQR